MIAEDGMDGPVGVFVSGTDEDLMQGFIRNPTRQTNPKRIRI